MGEIGARQEFGRRYLPVVRAYLHARWSGRLTADELEDAVQDVFVEFLHGPSPATPRAGTQLSPPAPLEGAD